jgi:hypothetical protein
LPDTTTIVLLDNQGIDEDVCDVWYDGIMVEEKVGDLSTPSAYHYTRDPDVDAAIAAAEQALADATAYIDGIADDLQGQIDGQVTQFTGTVAPSSSVTPESGWLSPDTRAEHVGDIYTNVTNGYSYRYAYIDNTYSWVQIVDSAAAEAFALASEAKDLADRKRRVFTTQPVPPYDEGDLWAIGTGASAVIKRCGTDKATEQSYAAGDWVDLANNLQEATQLADYANVNNANVLIGGTNLIKNSTVSSCLAAGTEATVTLVSQTLPTGAAGNVLKIVFSGTTGRYVDIVDPYSGTGTYSFSVWAKTGGSPFNVAIKDGNDVALSATESLAGTWKLIKLEGKEVTPTNNRIRVEASNNFTLYLWHPHNESGNKSTAWSPAPEDTITVDNKLTTNNISTLVADGAITNAYIGNVIQSSNYVAGSTGWKIDKAGNPEFNVGTFRGAVNVGSYTGYAWPASGGTGAHLSSSGLLLGNYNDGKYFQVTAGGNIYAPGFHVENGTLTISQANVINTLQIAGNSVSRSHLITSTGELTASRSITVLGRVHISAAFYGAGVITRQVYIKRNGEVLATYGAIVGDMYLIHIDEPTPGTYTYTAESSGALNSCRMTILDIQR